MKYHKLMNLSLLYYARISVLPILMANRTVVFANPEFL